MTLVEFEQQVFAAALASPICGIPLVRRLTPTSINLRIAVTTGGFIDDSTEKRSPLGTLWENKGQKASFLGR